MRVHVIGGFLGAGKTTLALALANQLGERGERVSLITNDQGHALVDTHWCARDTNLVNEITGGCFCCRFDELEAALERAYAAGATTVIAEAVGSCTDLVATVLSPLTQRSGARFEVAPLAVVVDPWRVIDAQDGRLAPDMEYLFRKQVEESDVVLVTRSDLTPPDTSGWLRSLNPNATVVPVSGVTGEGLDHWLEARPKQYAVPLDIDYERYVAAEAALGWCNGDVRITSVVPIQPIEVITRFLDAFRDEPVAHVKVTTLDPPFLRGALTRQHASPRIDADNGAAAVVDVRLLVNARVALAPSDLETRIRLAMQRAAGSAEVTWDTFACFQPAEPTPQHRHAVRCCTPDDGSCCAAFYDRPDVRFLLGDVLHPGGVELTLRVAEHMRLKRGCRILDVACGSGASLKAIRSRWDVFGFGLDVQPTSDVADGFSVRRGDAHAIPFDADSFDAVLCECALSTFIDAPRALLEMRRVVRPGGRVAISDMVVEGELPVSLERWAGVGTCLLRARSMHGYRALIADAGLHVVEEWDASDALFELLGRIKRSLVGFALARATGNLPADMHIDIRAVRAELREAERVIRAGTIRYGVYIAERQA